MQVGSNLSPIEPHIMRATLSFSLLGLLFLRAVPAFAETGTQTANSPRQSISLNGTWQFQREGSVGWKEVQVPSTFQEHEGTNFHGIGWYKKSVAPITLPRGKRVL